MRAGCGAWDERARRYAAYQSEDLHEAQKGEEHGEQHFEWSVNCLRRGRSGQVGWASWGGEVEECARRSRRVGFVELKLIKADGLLRQRADDMMDVCADGITEQNAEEITEGE
jgi:hypothetical protein